MRFTLEPLDGLDADTIASQLETLTQRNARLYRSGKVRTSPFALRYVPDPVAPRVTFSDAEDLERRGEGSCGELAAAYAGWLRAAGVDASAWVIDTTSTAHACDLAAPGTCSSWHAYAVDSAGVTYDPQEIHG